MAVVECAPMSGSSSSRTQWAHHRVSRGLSALLLLATTLTSAWPAEAQSPDDQAIELNVEAMEAYNEMDVETARKRLEQAMAIPGQTAMAQKRTYINLAIVHIDGLASNGPGGEFMLTALCLDPALELDPLTSTPNIIAAHKWARDQVAQGACGGGTSSGGGGSGNANIGMACSFDSECGAGLLCVDSACNPAGGGGDSEPSVSATLEPKKGLMFARLGLTVGVSYITHGMPADRKPGPNDPPPYSPGDTGGLVFTMPSPWQPDADSSDSMGRLTGCPEDGKQTIAPEEPSSYCVALKSPGLGGGFAFRLAGGYFITDKISAALLIRLQPSGGEGFLSHTLIGGRAEYWLGALGALAGSPLYGAAFAGLTVGQIQYQPSSNYDDGPYTQTGPVGIHGGMAFRYPLSSEFALYAAPELNLLFPDFLFHIDLTLAGIEMYF